MKFIYFIVFSLLSFFIKPISAQPLEKVYLDNKRNVHIRDANGEDRQITHSGNASSPRLAPDGKTVAWLVLNSVKTADNESPASEELLIYRNGKSASIRCTPFIRNYWFWLNGSQVAIDCGGRHFAGREILYDAKTLKELASFHQAELPIANRPEWSSNDN